MSLFDQWWDAANSLDRKRMGDLLHNDFIYVRHNRGDKLNKGEFIDLLMTGIRDEITSQSRRLIYENEAIIVSHSVLESPSLGKSAVMLVRLVKDGKIISMESGSTPLSI
ncbi:MAG: nuclear transport factor 2 family protein [Proteobacteria bacterium]|nr:nuclear transport factor 2 family protein [Pseudomonadota bacterium]